MKRPLIIIALAVILSSCKGGEGGSVVSADMVARVGGSVLTAAELDEKIPYGLDDDDRDRFVKAYVRQWIDSRLVAEVASRNISVDAAIEEKVEAYRNELIMMEYRRRMYEEHAFRELSDDSLRAVYEREKDDIKLTSPLVKGIYVKLPDDFAGLADVKKWIRSGNSDYYDRLEKLQLSNPEVMDYDYFLDRWVDWRQISERMPFGFDGTPEMYLRDRKNVEMSRGGYTYLVALYEVLPVGTAAPFDYVKESLREYVASDRRVDYDRMLRRRLFEEGVADGVVEVAIDLSE